MSTSEAQIALGPEGRLPRRFGRYALFDFIGKGGMAEIYLARAHTDLGASRLCVVKQILGEFALHPQFAEMLIHEAKLAARLNHAHIVQVFDLGRERDQLFIAMEYVEGFDLNALLRRCSQKKVPLPFEFAMRIVSDALSGLDYAHRRTGEDGRPLGIVHRDVSPSNLLVSLEGEVKVCDFGIAHANDVVFQHSDLQMDEAIRGKAGYMSPEHARGESIDARADVFAVGIVMWELLAGRRMYRRESDVALIDQAKVGEIPPLPEKALPHEAKLHGIVMKALAAKRDERYPSAGAMLRELDAYMSDAKMVASPLKLGTWLMDNFGAELIEQRRARDLPPEAPADSAVESPRVAVGRVSSPFLTIGATSAANGAGGGRISTIPPVPASSSAPPAAAAPALSSPPVSPLASSPAPTPGPVLEVKRVEPDPPSLPASVVDVVPSSAMRSGGFAAAKRKTSVVLLAAAVLGAIVLTLLALLARHR
jgi:serine/threonine-protein kinase